MKIRRKAPKPSRSGPAFVVGYAPPAPSLSELQCWFDLEYGGPLRVSESEREPQVRAEHGPWSALLEWLTEEEAHTWGEGLGWGHRAAVRVVPTTGAGASRLDQVMHLARLARGLTLLTQGTAYDLLGHRYLNPSDWTDLPLLRFDTADHVSVQQHDSPRPGFDWFLTRGLAKFGLDELETYRPLGLPDAPTRERLAAIAGLAVQRGLALKVGAALPLPELALAIDVLGHRTGQVDGATVSLREVSWKAVSSQG